MLATCLFLLAVALAFPIALALTFLLCFRPQVLSERKMGQPCNLLLIHAHTPITVVTSEIVLVLLKSLSPKVHAHEGLAVVLPLFDLCKHSRVYQLQGGSRDAKYLKLSKVRGSVFGSAVLGGVVF